MRFYIPECKYCKYYKNCHTYNNIKESFKDITLTSVISAKINCREFHHKISKGDIIRFNMLGNIITRPVYHVSNNNKTVLVLTAKNDKNKELFTYYQEWSCGSSEKEYFNADENSQYNNNLMIGFVRFSHDIKIIGHKEIPTKKMKMSLAPWELI